MTERAEVGARTPYRIRDAMQDAWNEICSDTGCHPTDITHERRKLFFESGHWATLTETLYEANPASGHADLHATVAALRKALEDLDAHWTEDFPNGPETSILHGSTRSVWRNVRAALALRDPAGKET